MPLWLLVILIFIATHRVTRLIVADSMPLLAAPREVFVRRWGRFGDAVTKEDKRKTMSGKPTNAVMSSLAYLWECPWCASMYVAPAVTYLAWRWTPFGDQHWYIIVLVALAASSVTGLVSQLESD